MDFYHSFNSRKDKEILISVAIGINDQLQYTLVYDRKTNNILVKSLVYNFVSVHQPDYEQLLIKNIPLQDFDIDNYYPQKIKNTTQ